MGRCTLSITDVVRVVACRLQRGGVQNAVRPVLQNWFNHLKNSQLFRSGHLGKLHLAWNSKAFKITFGRTKKKLQEEHEAYHFPFRHFHSAFA